jgi:SAM-dependent methyltransferase
MKSAYREDLAYIHDVGYTDFIRGATPGLLAILRKNRINNGVVIDLGCGTGVWAEALTRAGYDVLAVDISSSMLKLARKRAPRAKFVEASLFRFRLPKCRAVTAIGECVNYLFDRSNSRRQLGDFFCKVFAALDPGGLFLFDVAEPGRVGQPGPVMKHAEGRDWAILVGVEEEPRTHVLTRRITTFRKIGRSYRRMQETHRQQLHSRNDIAGLLNRAGFQVRLMSRYGRFKLAEGQVAFTAKKE